MPSHAHGDTNSTKARNDHALIVHVWHLDVLADMIEAVDNLPEATDQYVSIPSVFGAAERERVAAAFPRARQITVENVGRDVGALFQLMSQVDLSRYAFVCKIHTKKGPNMPSEWRRALLDGVLGSKQQVHNIIDRFRADPMVMMAGSRQLFLHGPSCLDQNAEGMLATFGKTIGDFDLHRGDWGFVAGTCFWIRTSILTELAACNPDFQRDIGVPDGTLAHATERMFGLSATLRRGKVLLQDLRFADRLPDVEQGFPSTLPRRKTSLSAILTPLAANMILKPPTTDIPDERVEKPLKPRQRVAVFTSFSENGMLPAQVIPYLEGLKQVTSAIIVVCDNDFLPSEKDKLSRLATHVITGRHGEYDFGFYQSGAAWAQLTGLLHDADDLILCNDSCFGPIRSFEPMFKVMDARNHDFWSVTDSQEISYHLQSYFLVFSRDVFQSTIFTDFLAGIKEQAHVQEKNKEYELGLTKVLIDTGFKAGALVGNQLQSHHPNDHTYDNITSFPLYAITRGSPLLKVDVMKLPHMNMDGPNRTLACLKEMDPELYDVIAADLDLVRFSEADDVAFSIILPTRNRVHCVSRAIRSVLCQSHKNFQLVIVDDGSTDNTRKMIREEFADNLASGKILYVNLEQSVGVSAARNIGLAYARNPWISYLDSDNEIRPHMLTMFANEIARNVDREAFYAKILMNSSGREIGMEFDRDALLKRNYIDLGVYVHSKSLIHKFGGFDEGMKRLVDWDMIIRHTKGQDPFFINRVCLDYDDDGKTEDRITVRESFIKARTNIYSKYGSKPTVSTVIVSYNHSQFIVEAIESAIEQRGEFNHEILISDDGSTDGTARIISRYVKKYPHLVRDISRIGNFGVSDNYRHCFSEAEGHYIAVLEGDDYWTDPEKNFKQADFLDQNKNASMVFSRFERFDMRNNTETILERQMGLPDLLTAADFAKDENLNLIVNLSCCMFRSDIMKRLPAMLYDPRLSEIALAFYLDRFGTIGFIPQVMSRYRIHDRGVWNGADSVSQLRQAIGVRQCAFRAARPIYRSTIQKHINRKQTLLSSALKKMVAPA